MSAVPSLYKNLSDLQFVPQKKLDALWSESKEEQERFEQLLLESGVISDENLGKVIADMHEWQFIKLSQQALQQKTLQLIPEAFCRAHNVVAYEQDGTALKVAMSNPYDLQTTVFLNNKFGEDILRVAYATNADIEEALKHYGLVAAKDQVEESDEATLFKDIDAVILHAVKQQASDIHIEPGEQESLIRLRIDGFLHDIATVSPAEHQQMVTRTKVLAKLRTDEHQAAQDGKIQMEVLGEKVDLRVSIVPTTKGEKIVMRLLTNNIKEYTLADLGFTVAQNEILHTAINKPYGMILSTGPTGSGKTTTLYTLLKIINTRSVNIMTIEDPVEYTIPTINQIQVNEATNLTFAEGLRSIVRQDPNVILVGEIRDPDTAKIAINAAMTGHMVLSTLHTNTAATAIPRLVDMELEPFLISSAVTLVIAQRLLRKICSSCRVSEELNLQDIIEEYSVQDPGITEVIKKYFSKQKTIRLFKGKGCQVCHDTGYQGRVGIFELLEITPTVRTAITEQKDAGQIQEIAVTEGMVTMLEDGLEKVSQGLTTLDEILRVTKE